MSRRYTAERFEADRAENVRRLGERPDLEGQGPRMALFGLACLAAVVGGLVLLGSALP